MIWLNTGNQQKSYADVQDETEVTFHFQNEQLISGSNNSVNAVYKFSSVAPGIDAHLKILAFYNGASVSDVDHFSAGYQEAWQPFVHCKKNGLSYVDWRITFKKAGTAVDTIIPYFSVTAVDVDGDNSSLKEFVQSTFANSYSTSSDCILTITYDGMLCHAISTFYNVANIDTSHHEVMFQMNFENLSTFDYRTGAVGAGAGGTIIRQNCIYMSGFFPVDNGLPIALVNFDAELTDDHQVKLNWTTATEINNDYFTIERSSNSEDFEPLSTLDGAGNSTETLNYEFVDENPMAGDNYYRLRQTDYDGKFEIFPVEHVNVTHADLAILSAGPNPFHDEFTVNYASLNSNLKITLLNTSGIAVRTKVINAETSAGSFTWSQLADLPAGIYIVMLADEKRFASYKILKG